VRFQILGSLRVDTENSTLTLGPPKQRCLLAALLLEPNRIVSMERLAAAIWDGDAPVSWTANIRTYASGLRAALAVDAEVREHEEDAAGERLLSRTPGYGLAVGEHELDLTEFRRFAGWGRSALQAGDAYTAVANFDAALKLWRGCAAEDLRCPAALARRLSALDEERLAAIEDWAMARQALGQHRSLVPKLRDLTEAHPLRERLWSILMLALYCSGDVSGALEAFRQARCRLAEDLGLEPGPTLVRLHQAVLARDASLESVPTFLLETTG
jgi:DNA-binding SARP family transcriptional activator